MNTYFNKLVQKSYVLFLAALIAVNTYGADITAVNTGMASGTHVAAAATLVATPVELFSLTISGGATGTNVVVTLRDSASTSLTTTATYSTMGSYLTNLVRTYTNPYGVSTSVTNYGVQVTYTNTAASVTTAKPTVAALTYTPGTPITYTFSPPLVFAQGLTLTNSQATGSATNTGFTITYGYSPAF